MLKCEKSVMDEIGTSWNNYDNLKTMINSAYFTVGPKNLESEINWKMINWKIG